MKKHGESVERFKTLLNVLFQFDVAELDFGIYRIMNYRRKEIESFVEKDLIQATEKEFEIYKTQSEKELLEKIREIEKRIRDGLGDEAIKNGQVIEKYSETRLAKAYTELKKQLGEAEVTESAQAQVFNDLYTFFSRYYEDGDFISKRRYSSRDTRYAIPYNGEEVKLYWANFDQYYVKTGEVFKDYEFDSNGWRIIFRTTFADVESGNVKGERRYFLLAPSDSLNVDKENKACLIQFEYRRLAEEDLSKYKIKTKTGEEKRIGIQQDELNVILNGMILEKIKEAELKAVLSEKQDEKTVIQKHLYKYTHKITSDFFIHKNLKGFLDRELDYFIKTEVLDIDNLDPRHITRAKVVENIGKRITEFLSQIEKYQKLLWEKKKFVLRTDYVITTDRMPEEFQQEVLRCPAQLQEWQDLGLGQITEKKDLDGKKLPIDTRHFDGRFKEMLLGKLCEQGNLDDLIDGILIKSENWQALSLLLSKYRGKIQCIYIDPPFNTGTNEFLYKNNYLDSSWITMMYDRLDLGSKLLKDDGSIFERIDYHGNHYIRFLMDMIFAEANLRNEIAINRISKKGFAAREAFKAQKYPVSTDSLFWYGKTERGFFLPYELSEKPKGERWHAMDVMDATPSIPKPRVILGKEMLAPPRRKWMYSQEKINEMEKQGLIKLNAKGKPIYRIKSGGFNLLDTNWTDIPGYSFGWDFPTENSETLLRRVIEASSQEGDWLLDYFLGSGTTTAIAHKLKRKWIGIEMGQYFEGTTLRRMKLVLAGEGSGISKKVNWQGGGFFKYQYLEQYEDTLHNIEFPNEGKGQLWLKLFPEETSEYVMKYMLRYETEGSPSLLNVKQLDSPFEYKLRTISDGRDEKIVSVDLVETFNYLLGLTVSRYNFLSENGRKYVIVLGERGNRRVAVVWRPTKDIDLEKDKEVIEQTIGDFHPDEVFINGDAYIKDYKVIESEFKALAGA